MLPARADPITQIGFPQLEHFAPLLSASNASFSAMIISSLFAFKMKLNMIFEGNQYEPETLLRCVLV